MEASLGQSQMNPRRRPEHEHQGRRAASPAPVITVEHYRELLDGLVSSHFSRDQPDVLYHYTYWRAAESILKNRQFWVTDHACTEDPAELKAADGIIREQVERFRMTAQSAEQSLLDMFLAGFATLNASQMVPAYLTCFSDRRDDAYHWDHYGRETGGGTGVSLGIRILKTERSPISPADTLGRWLCRVDYSPAAWKEQIGQGFRGILLTYRKYLLQPSADRKLALRYAWNALLRVAAVASISAKDPGYLAEAEWRLVALDFNKTARVPQVRASERTQQQIRYLQVCVREPGLPLAIDEIIVGWNQPFETACKELQRILYEAGYPHPAAPTPTISRSQVPSVSPAPTTVEPT